MEEKNSNSSETQQENMSVENIDETKINVTPMESEANSIDSQVSAVPAKHFFQMNAQRLGQIFSNLSICLAVFSILCFSAMVLYPLASITNVLLAIIAIIFTLGLIFIKFKFSDLLIFDINNSNGVIETSLNLGKYALIAVLITSILSLVFLMLNKRKRSISRIVLSIIFIIISLVGVVLVFSGM